MSNSFNAAEIVAQAVEQTGLSDFGPDGWQEPLELLLETASAEARLNSTGEMILLRETGSRLNNRLRIQKWLTDHPDAPDQHFEAPIVLATLPRTGQTAAGWILDRDPDNRSLLRWFAKDPIPPPNPRELTTDPRIAREASQIRFLPDEVMKMHLTAADEPDECHWLISNDMKVPHEIYSMHVPTYYRWIRDHADMRAAYEYYALQLRILQSSLPPQRWVLKNSPHLLHLEELYGVMPDATFVQIHRDPLKVLESNCKLTVLLRKMRSDHVDLHEVGSSMLELLSDYTDGLLQFREHTPACHWVDLRFSDFVQDPMAAITSIYRAADIELTTGTAKAMTSWVKANPRNDLSKIRPADLSPYGIDDKSATDRFSDYIRHFEISCDGV